MGDVFPGKPGVSDGFVGLGYKIERFLILGWPSPAGSLDVTWAFVLEEPKPGCTWLIARVRAGRVIAPFWAPLLALKTLVPLGI